MPRAKSSAESPRHPQRIALAERVELLLERRRSVARPVNQRRQVPELGARPGRDDDGAPLAAHDARADEEHRRAVAERRVVGDGGARVLLDGHALARERALLREEADRLQQARVGRHGVARLELEDVAGDEAGRRDDLDRVAAPDARVRGLHRLERGERRLGALLLERSRAPR